MEATHANSEHIQVRLSALKDRISSKRSTADILFFGPQQERSSGHTQEALESILQTLQKQQEDEGNLDTTIH